MWFVCVCVHACYRGKEGGREFLVLHFANSQLDQILQDMFSLYILLWSIFILMFVLPKPMLSMVSN